MKPDTTDVEITSDAAAAYAQLSAERQRTLAAPEDDMWATFADLATPYSLTSGGQLVGRFSLDEERQLHGFYVGDQFEAMTTELFARVVYELDVSAVVTSTVDPVLLSLCLTAGGTTEPRALMYDRVAGSEIERSVDVRIAGDSDHAAAAVFGQAEMGSPEAFLVPYLTQRIERSELYLVEAAGQIVASGECRVDTRAPGNAHLGFVVGTAHRGDGLGSRLMHTLAEISRGQGLTPRCSTEPGNVAAQKAIRRAGFRTRHQVFSLALSPG